MEDQSVWTQPKWTEEARHLIDGLNQFPEDSKIILVIRHSHRNSIETFSDMVGLRLSPLGHEIAKIFGSKLPKNKSIRVFYSPIERCKETAEDILLGFKNVSGKGILKEPLDVLYNQGEDSDYFFNEATKYPYAQFLYRWVADLYPSDKIIPFDKFCQNAANVLWNKIDEIPERNIDVHVSHDLIILSFRLGWFGLSPNGRWPSFLGGFAFTINGDNILLLDSDKLITVEIPYWWKST